MPSRKTVWVLLLCTVTLAGAGCHRRTAHAAPPVVVPTPDPQSAPPSMPPPDIKATPPADNSPSPSLAPATSVPPPKPAAGKPRPATPDPPAPKPTPPQITPRLSPEEQADAEKRTREDMDAAKKNLERSFGRTLNAAQQDLVEKINGFLAQAREAIQASDWFRARNLAQKARVLSVELVDSL